MIGTKVQFSKRDKSPIQWKGQINIYSREKSETKSETKSEIKTNKKKQNKQNSVYQRYHLQE